MKLGGIKRNMITEPFKEKFSIYAVYGEYKMQDEKLVNTTTEPNPLKPDPLKPERLKK